MKALLDTNAYAAFRKGDPAVRTIIAGAQRVVLSAVVAGELLHGFRQGTRRAENERGLAEFLEDARVDFLEVGWETADWFGRVMTGLRRRGTPVPTNDVWIAAHAMEAGAHLVSYDRHFAHIEGLAWVHPEG